MDSTLWDTGGRVREVVLEITGETLDLEAVATWAHVLDVYGEQVTTEIVTRVLSRSALASASLTPARRRFCAACKTNAA